MADWFRSITILATAFVGVMVVTLGLAMVVVPSAAPVGGDDSPAPGASDAGPGPVADWTPGEVGGTLVVTGDHESTLHLGAESIELGYALTGEDGRIAFDTDPLTVSQISVAGFEIYPDPDECELTPGARDDETGVAGLGLRCDGVADIRDEGTVTIEGTVGIAADLLGLRGDLPEPGGTMTIGPETYAIDEAELVVPPVHRTTPTYVGQLVTADGRAALTLTYGDAFHVEEIQAGGELLVVPADTCTVTDEEIGVLNPHTRVVELTVACEGLELPSLGGSIALDGAVIVELVELPV